MTIPAGAVAGSGTVSGRVVRAPAPAPTGMILLGEAYEFEVSGTRLTRPVTVSLPVDLAAQDGYPPAALLVYFDTSTHAWTPVPAVYHADTHMMVAQTPHLSNWVLETVAGSLKNWVLGTFKSFIGVNDVAAQPSCPGTAQATSAGITVVSSSGSLVKWCVGDQDGQAVLQVADDRAFAVEIDYPSGWAVERDAWPDLDSAAVDGVAGFLSVAPRGEKAVIVPGGESVTFTAAPGASGQAQVDPSSEAYLVSALLYGVGTLVSTTEELPWISKPTPGAALSTIQHLFDLKDCVSSMESLDRQNVTSVSSAVGLFWNDLQSVSSCLGDAWETAYGTAGAVTQFLVSTFEWLMDGLKLISQGIGGAIESAVYWQAYRITLTSPAVQPVFGSSAIAEAVSACTASNAPGIGTATIPAKIRLTTPETVPTTAGVYGASVLDGSGSPVPYYLIAPAGLACQSSVSTDGSIAVTAGSSGNRVAYAVPGGATINAMLGAAYIPAVSAYLDGQGVLTGSPSALAGQSTSPVPTGASNVYLTFVRDPQGQGVQGAINAPGGPSVALVAARITDGTTNVAAETIDCTTASGTATCTAALTYFLQQYALGAGLTEQEVATAARTVRALAAA
ncbi:MAG TPA: hypothetical protein VL551_24315 [Actinospica sp.]|nr:hypothetical protein [Actinospica sp.]